MKYNNANIRRKDRLLEEKKATELLIKGEYGVLSMCSEVGNGAYGIPLSFVWDEKENIYIHCAQEGRKLKCLEQTPNVSFCVIGKTNVLSDKFTTEYESIVISCIAHTGLSEEERIKALKLFIKKYSPNHQNRGDIYIEKSFHRTQIICLNILNTSGKCKQLK